MAEHICLAAVHVFTPDLSQVTVWVAPSPSPSHYRPTPTRNPTEKGFPPYCRGNSSAPAQVELVQRRSVSRLNHTHRHAGPGRAATGSEGRLDSKVIKAIKAN